jgi:hypothetical protein
MPMDLYTADPPAAPAEARAPAEPPAARRELRALLQQPVALSQLDPASLSFLGVPMSPEVARDAALARLDPSTMLPYVDEAPGLCVRRDVELALREAMSAGTVRTPLPREPRSDGAAGGGGRAGGEASPNAARVEAPISAGAVPMTTPMPIVALSGKYRARRRNQHPSPACVIGSKLLARPSCCALISLSSLQATTKHQWQVLPYPHQDSLPIRARDPTPPP